MEPIRDYGYKGIDTPQERAQINYNPVISYIKRVIDEDQRSLVEEFVPSEDLSYMIKYNIPAARAAVREANSSLEECLKLLRERLAGVVVTISGTSAEMVRSYVGDDVINFSSFDKSCRENSEEAKATRFHFIETLDSIEAYAYFDIVQLETDLKDCQNIAEKDLPELAVAAGYTATVDEVDGAVEQRTKAWIDWEFADFLKPSHPAEHYFEDLNEKLDQRHGLNNDPVPVISKLVIERAYDISNLSDSFKNLVLLDLSDVIADEIDEVIKGILIGLGLEKPADYNEKYHRAKESLRTLRTILTLVNATTSVKIKDLSDIVLMIASPLVSEISRKLLYAVSKLKCDVTSPALSFLQSVEEGVDVNLRTIDLIADTIMDTADEIEAKFQDAILDFYRNTKEKTDNIGKKIGMLERKKWAKAVMAILDAIEWGLDRVSPEQIDEILHPRVDIRGYVYEMIDHLGWFDRQEE